jgi:hypothetical protein
MKRSRKLRLFWIFSIFVASATSLAYALPTHETEWTYYADSTFESEVGSRVLSCNGRTYATGRTTPHFVRYSAPCATNGSPRVSCYVNRILTICPANICDSKLFSC